MSNPTAKSAPRDRLLDAAIEMVASNGYVGTTVEQLIGSAKSSRSTFYAHFNCKDDCIRSAAERIMARIVSEVEARIGADRPQLAAKLVAETLLEFAFEQQAQARVLFTELLAGGSQTRELRDGLVDRLAGLIERASSQVADRAPTVDLPARAFVGGIFRLLSFRMRHGGKGPYELQSAILDWLDAYALQDARPRWQSVDSLDAFGAQTATAVTPEMPPPQLPRGRHGLRASEIARNHRERLLHATAACAYKDGYDAVTVSDVVHAARVSRSVFYELFQDKQAAATAAMELTFESSMARCVREFFAASGGWPVQLWAGARALSDYYASAPSLVHLAFVEGYAVGTSAIQQVESRMMAFTTLLEPGYQLRDQPLDREASTIIACATFELAYREVRHRQPREFSNLLPQLAYMNLAPFMGAAEATRFIDEAISAQGLESPDAK